MFTKNMVKDKVALLQDKLLEINSDVYSLKCIIDNLEFDFRLLVVEGATSSSRDSYFNNIIRATNRALEILKETIDLHHEKITLKNQADTRKAHIKTGNVKKRIDKTLSIPWLDLDLEKLFKKLEKNLKKLYSHHLKILLVHFPSQYHAYPEVEKKCDQLSKLVDRFKDLDFKIISSEQTAIITSSKIEKTVDQIKDHLRMVDETLKDNCSHYRRDNNPRATR